MSRKQPQEQLSEAEQKYRTLVEQIPGVVPHILYLFDLLKGTSIYLNEKSVTVLGYSPEEFCQADPQWFMNCFHPDDRHLCYDIPSRFVNLQDNEVLSTEYRFRHKNGEWCWLNMREVVFLATITRDRDYLKSSMIFRSLIFQPTFLSYYNSIRLKLL
ncbi:PAS domain-containing protein [Nostoc sp.]|uniref:PAS domain-containing protein n=1 Tax=Nostoc sp. TaxID=1180 RepID=UPI002FFC712A